MSAVATLATTDCEGSKAVASSSKESADETAPMGAPMGSNDGIRSSVSTFGLYLRATADHEIRATANLTREMLFFG